MDLLVTSFDNQNESNLSIEYLRYPISEDIFRIPEKWQKCRHTNVAQLFSMVQNL